MCLNTLRLGAWTRSARKRRLDYRVDCNNRTVRERAEQLLQSAREATMSTQTLREAFYSRDQSSMQRLVSALLEAPPPGSSTTTRTTGRTSVPKLQPSSMPARRPR